MTLGWSGQAHASSNNVKSDTLMHRLALAADGEAVRPEIKFHSSHTTVSVFPSHLRDMT